MPPTTFPDTLTHKNFTLIFPLSPTTKTLTLGLKKRGFGKGCYNGFGGKVEPGESILAGATRELLEESTLLPTTPSAMHYVGLLLFHTLPPSPTPTDKGLLQVVYVFTLDSYTGTPTETEEMAPREFHYPLAPEFLKDNMLPSTRHWLPTLLEDVFEKNGEGYGEGEGFCYYAAWESGSRDMLNCVLKKRWRLGGLEDEEVVGEEVLEVLMREAKEQRDGLALKAFDGVGVETETVEVR